MSLYFLENEKLKIAVDSMGAELSSIIRKADGTEMLWQGGPRFWGRKSPVLFPVVGKYKNLKTTYMGKEYRLGQHGFARDSEFTLLEKNESGISFELCESEESLAVYPFRFRLICSFILEGSSVRVCWRVVNTDSKAIYFSIGAHPAFYIEKGKTVLNMKNGKDITYNLINSEGLYTDRRYAISPSVTLTEELFDNDALIIQNSGVSEISLSDKNGEYLSVSFDAPLFGIWSPARKNAPFVCIEPWYGRCDAEYFDGDITEREWGNTLSEGEEFYKEYKITVNEK